MSIVGYINSFVVLSFDTNIHCRLLIIPAFALYWILSTIICKEVGPLMNILSLIRLEIIEKLTYVYL
jgi:hypothetical protein